LFKFNKLSIKSQISLENKEKPGKRVNTIRFKPLENPRTYDWSLLQSHGEPCPKGMAKRGFKKEDVGLRKQIKEESEILKKPRHFPCLPSTGNAPLCRVLF